MSCFGLPTCLTWKSYSCGKCTSKSTVPSHITFFYSKLGRGRGRNPISGTCSSRVSQNHDSFHSPDVSLQFRFSSGRNLTSYERPGSLLRPAQYRGTHLLGRIAAKLLLKCIGQATPQQFLHACSGEFDTARYPGPTRTSSLNWDISIDEALILASTIKLEVRFMWDEKRKVSGLYW